MAGRLELDVAHQLSHADALARIQALADFYHHKHHAQITWSGDRCAIQFRYLGIKLSANARVDERGVHVDATDPGFLLRKRGADYLRKKLERYLEPTTPLESLPRA